MAAGYGFDRGCGETRCDDLPGISIPFLVTTARAVLGRVRPPGGADVGQGL